MKTKQTAVDWLYNMLHNEEVIIYHGLFELWYKQAKAMEEEQIKDAFWNGDNSDCTSEQNSFEFAEQYYNETYNQQENESNSNRD